MRSLLLATAFLTLATQNVPEGSNGSVRGTVTQAGTNEPLADVRIELGNGIIAVTDREGRFAFENILPGNYTVFVQRDGYLLAGKSSLSFRSAAGSMTIGQREVVEDVHIKMLPESRISGRVLVPANGPVVAAEVTVFRVFYMDGRRRLKSFVSQKTDDQGRYRFLELPPGEYYLLARSTVSLGGKSHAATYLPSETDPAQSTPLTIKAGDEIARVDITLQAAQTTAISGTVVPPPQAQGENVGSRLFFTVARRSQPELQPGQGIGVFSIAANIPSQFRIQLSTPGSYDLFVADRIGNANYFGEAPISAGGVPVDGVAIRLRPNVDLKGSVVFKGSAVAFQSDTAPIDLRPLSDLQYYASMSLTKASTGSGTIVWNGIPVTRLPEPPAKPALDLIGNLTLRSIAEGRYAIHPSLPPGVYLADVLRGGKSILDSGLEVTADRNEPLEVIIVGNGATIKGALLNKLQQPVGFSTVALVPDTPNRRTFGRYQTAVSNHRGQFTFTDVAPGGYKLFAWSSVTEGAWTSADYLMKDENSGTPVTVREGQELENVRVSLIE